MEEVFLDPAAFPDWDRTGHAPLIRWLTESGSSEVCLDRSKWSESGCSWDDLVSVSEAHAIVWVSETECLTTRNRFADPLASALHLGTVETEETEDDVSVFSFDTANPTAAGDRAFELLFKLLGQNPAALVNERVDIYITSHAGLEFSPVSAETLALLNKGRLGDVVFHGWTFSEQHCHVLAAMTHPDMLSFADCSLGGGRLILGAVAEDRGPTQLGFESGTILDSGALETALSHTTRLETLELWNCSTVDIPSLMRGLIRNRSLIELTLWPENIDEGQWAQLILSLRRHPTLKKLKLLPAQNQLLPQVASTDGDKVRRARVVLELLNTNEVLETIEMRYVLDSRIFEEEILPRLKRNRYLARVKALLNEPNASLQKRLVSAALASREARDEPTLMWLLVSTFHKFVSDQFELVDQKQAAGPVSCRTHNRKRRRDM